MARKDITKSSRAAERSEMESHTPAGRAKPPAEPAIEPYLQGLFSEPTAREAFEQAPRIGARTLDALNALLWASQVELGQQHRRYVRALEGDVKRFAKEEREADRPAATNHARDRWRAALRQLDESGRAHANTLKRLSEQQARLSKLYLDHDLDRIDTRIEIVMDEWRAVMQEFAAAG